MWELSCNLEFFVPTVLASCTVFSTHSSGIAWEPGTAETLVLAKYEWCSVTCRPMWVTLKGKKALTENTVFNLAGMVNSSWPSCLLSGCGHETRAHYLRHYPVLIGRGGHLPACCLPHSSAVMLGWLGHAIYLSGSINLFSHIHLKMLTKCHADFSRKKFHPLCREPGNQSPESISS